MPRIKIVKLPSKKKLKKYQTAGSVDDQTAATIKFTNSGTDLTNPYAADDAANNAIFQTQTNFPLGDPRNDIHDLTKKDNEQQAYDQSSSNQIGIDFGLYGKQGSRTQRNQYNNFLNDKYNANIQPDLTKAQKFSNGLYGASRSLQKGLQLGSLAANMKQSENASDAARRKFMQTPVLPGGDHGDYFKGILKPDEYTVNKGMYTNKFNPSMNFAEYGGPMYAGGGGFESVIPEDVISNYSINTPIISPDVTPSSMGTSSSSSDAGVANAGSSYSKSSSKDIASFSNNPLNLHYGKFAQKYNGVPGADDVGGKVAIFPDLETGLQANKDLLFGPNYNKLTISEARKKWVGYDNPSIQAIVNAMGEDKKLLDLNSEEKSKLFKLFAKWESKQGYNKIKDISIFNNGGQNSNTMKIRITGTPEEKMAGGGQPQYSGQSDYGLYIGQRNLYRAMPQNPYENPGHSVTQKKETPNDPYVLEAEGGETILRPDGTHMNITGDRHTEGGEKLTKSQAPEGSFIYSDTKKMKIGGEILSNFGKGKTDSKKYTPAALAKQYNVNKYKAILADPNSDTLAKKTAKKMIENYEDKLAQLALVQEGMKGFPKGIPKVAEKFFSKHQAEQSQQMPSQAPQEAAYGGAFGYGGDNIPDDPEYGYGGLTSYQTEGQVTEEARKLAKKIKAKTQVTPDYNYLGKLDNSEYWKRTQAGQAGQEGTGPQTDPYRGPKMSNSAWLRFLQTPQGQSYKQKYITGTPGTQGTEDVTDYLVYNDDPRSRLVSKTIPTPEEWPGITQTPGPKPGEGIPYRNAAPFKAGRLPFFSYDMAVVPQQEKVYAAPSRNVIPLPTFYDPTRALAENASLAKQFTEGYQGSVQGYSGASNAAQMKAAENAANITGDYQNKDVGVANQYAQLQAQIESQDLANDAERRDKIGFNTEQAKKAQRSLAAKYLNKWGQLDKNDYTTRTNTNMVNAMNPYFNIGYGRRSANVQFKPGVDAMSLITGQFNFPGQQRGAATPNYQQYLKEMNDFKQQYPNLGEAAFNKAYSMKYPQSAGRGMSGAGNKNAMAAFMAQAMGNNQQYGANTQGYDMGDLYDQYDQYATQQGK